MLYLGSPSRIARQERTLAEIGVYPTEIKHVSGKANSVTNALSRMLVNATKNSVAYEAVADEQGKDAETIGALTSIMGLHWTEVNIGNGSKTLLCDTSQGTP